MSAQCNIFGDGMDCGGSSGHKLRLLLETAVSELTAGHRNSFRANLVDREAQPAAVNTFASLENSEKTTIPRSHRGGRGLRLTRRELSHQCPIELKISFN
ncbi:hypothetical protein SRHO_G00086260 [Serrasalmus rhombeus]